MQPLENAACASKASCAQPAAAPGLSSASHLLSELTQFAGVVVAPALGRGAHPPVRVHQPGRKSHPADHRHHRRRRTRIASLTGRAHTPTSSTALPLTNEHFAGLSLRGIRRRLGDELRQLRGDMSELMTATVDAGSEAAEDNAASYVISGETKLLDVADLSTTWSSCAGSSLFEQRTGLLQLLDLSSRAEGVQIFIGGESGLARSTAERSPRALRGRRPSGRLARRHRPPHGHDRVIPDRRHHCAAGASAGAGMLARGA